MLSPRLITEIEYHIDCATKAAEAAREYFDNGEIEWARAKAEIASANAQIAIAIHTTNTNR
jgi:hypothetical protein